MIPRAFKLFGVSLSFCALSCALGAAQRDDPASLPPLDSLDHAALTAAMKSLADRSGELVSYLEVGRSRAGREIGALVIAAGELEPGRPAILLVGNVDGAHVHTSALALAHARSLVADHGKDEAVTAFLESTTLYVIPRADPDAAEARFESPRFERAGSGRGIDNDRDGRDGEDAPGDVNGDGLVTWMRVLDPEGEWALDPTDPRILVEADSSRGERGKWKLWREGRDADGDEEVAEDPPLDCVVNRNFSHRWTSHQARGGTYPTSEPAALALAEFVLEHRDIAAVLTYGAAANLEERDSGGRDRSSRDGDDEGSRRSSRGRGAEEPEGTLEGDHALYSELYRRYEEITDREPVGEEDEEGAFHAWVYHHRGLLSVAVNPWTIPLEEKRDRRRGGAAPEEEETPGEGEQVAEETPEPSDDARRLNWLEANGRPDAHLGWSAFQHPELGPVEIGGFAPYALIEPPPGKLDELADGERAFLLELGRVLPRIAIPEAVAEKLSDGLYLVRVTLENEALVPIPIEAARRTRHVRGARVKLELPDGATLLSGNALEVVTALPAAGGRGEERWLVRTDSVGSISVLVESDNAGSARAKVEVEVR